MQEQDGESDPQQWEYEMVPAADRTPTAATIVKDPLLLFMFMSILFQDEEKHSFAVFLEIKAL